MLHTTDYQQQAIDFLNSTKSKMEIKFLRNGKHFQDDKNFRDIYEVTISRADRSYSFKFGQSIAKSSHYLDKKTKRTYTMNGGALNSNYKIVNLNYLKNNRDFVIVKGEAPDFYDVLSCLQKYDISTFEQFCDEFGYDTDSKKAEATYKAVKDEYLNLCALFSPDEMEVLREIN